MIFAAVVLFLVGVVWTLLGAVAVGVSGSVSSGGGRMALFMSLSGIAVLIIGVWIGALS